MQTERRAPRPRLDGVVDQILTLTAGGLATTLRFDGQPSGAASTQMHTRSFQVAAK